MNIFKQKNMNVIDMWQNEHKYVNLCTLLALCIL